MDAARRRVSQRSTFRFSNRTIPRRRPATAPNRCPAYLRRRFLTKVFETGRLPCVGFSPAVVVVEGVDDVKEGEGDNKCDSGCPDRWVKGPRDFLVPVSPSFEHRPVLLPVHEQGGEMSRYEGIDTSGSPSKIVGGIRKGTSNRAQEYSSAIDNHHPAIRIYQKKRSHYILTSWCRQVLVGTFRGEGPQRVA